VKDIAIIAADHEAEMQSLRRQYELRSNLVGTAFDDAPKEYTDVYVYGEIISARDFEPGRLCIEYTIQLPAGWKQIAGIPNATTSLANAHDQQIRGLVGKTPRVYTFGQPLEMRFTAASLDQWPIIYFMASSFDMWDRSVVEGYGFATIPSCGSQTITVPTWKPVGSIRQKMSSFFIGGKKRFFTHIECFLLCIFSCDVRFATITRSHTYRSTRWRICT